MIKTDEIKTSFLMQGDCFEEMKKIPDGSIDLILCDPPYNLANYSTGNMKFDWRSEINNDVAEWDQKPLEPQDLVEEFRRILSPKGNIFIFCSYNLLGKFHEVFDPVFDTFQFMVWHKTNPVPNIRKSSFLNSCELIVCLWNKGHTWNFTTQNQMHNFFESPICMGSERLKNPKHPTQKPLKILKHIIGIASNPGDLVLDMFMGVGSTGVAARELDRRFIGIELDPVYFEASEKRIAETEEKKTAEEENDSKDNELKMNVPEENAPKKKTPVENAPKKNAPKKKAEEAEAKKKLPRAKRKRPESEIVL